jgi:hypothetical protein
MPNYEIEITFPATTVVEGNLRVGPTGPQGPAGADGTGFTAGDLAVRYDATQPTRDCLWVAPSGQVVLITGS